MNIEPPNPNLQGSLDILISIPILPLEHPNPEPLFDSIPETLWSNNASDIGGIHSAPPVKTQIDERKLLLDVKQYPLNIEAIRGFKLATEDYLQRN